MLVRLKKRGNLPPHTVAKPLVRTVSISAWRGCCIEVEPTGFYWPCGAAEFKVVDARRLSQVLVPQGSYLSLCAHYLIDDVDAYESDHDDEEAEIGDIATSAQPAKIENVLRGER